jgi:hypothetical protein
VRSEDVFVIKCEFFHVLNVNLFCLFSLSRRGRWWGR